MQNVRQVAKYTNLSASALIKTGQGVVYGFVVNSHTGGTLKLWDNTSAATTVLLNTITFAAGPNFVSLPVGVQFGVGLYATIGGQSEFQKRLDEFDRMNQELISVYNHHLHRLEQMLMPHERPLIEQLRPLTDLLYWRRRP
jgi:hypothetical protein